MHKCSDMLLCMRTTVELPPDLLIEAKKLAAELRVPLRMLIEEGLRKRLERKKRADRRPSKIHWVTVDGGINNEFDLADREKMHNRLFDPLA